MHLNFGIPVQAIHAGFMMQNGHSRNELVGVPETEHRKGYPGSARSFTRVSSNLPESSKVQ